MTEDRSLVGCSECKKGFPYKTMTAYGDGIFLCEKCEAQVKKNYLDGRYCGACGEMDCDCTSEMKRRAFKEAFNED